MVQENPCPPEWAAKIEDLVRRAKAIADPEAKQIVLDLLRGVMEFHAAALDRLLSIVITSKDGDSVIDTLATDDLVASLLLLHNLHPDDYEARIARAVDKLRLRLNPRGADVTLLGAESGLVRIRYDGPRNGHIAGARTLIQEAVLELAPETIEVIVEGVQEPAPNGFVPLAALSAGQLA